MKLTDEQNEIFEAIMQWVNNDKKTIAILIGSAGTGKTTLLKSIVESLDGAKKSYVLLAPTGRAARILGKKTGKPSKTIHSEIYELGDIKADEHSDVIQGDFDSPGFTIPFKLKDIVDSKATVYIVDESSMVSDKTTQHEILSFGSGRLLHDLLHYARIINSKTAKSKILFVGDEAQLPPVKCSDSPALNKNYFLTEFQKDSSVFRLNKVIRQAAGSLILENAEKIRKNIFANQFCTFSITEDGNTVKKISPIQVVNNALENPYASNSVIITVSNHDALSYNNAIRRRRFGAQNVHVQKGDILLVCRNSAKYFNGDLLVVVEVDPYAECRSVNIRGNNSTVDVHYRTVIVRSVDEEGNQYNQQCKIIENLLTKSGATLSVLENRAIMVDFRMRHPKIEINSPEFRQKLISDEYFNAVLVKFGYAITCHKAQGGEWNDVSVNFSGFPSKGADFYRWAYTAITRSRETLCVIDPPSFGTPDISGTNSKIDKTSNELSDADTEIDSLKKDNAQKIKGDISGNSLASSAADNRGEKWSNDEDKQLLFEFSNNKSIKEIAKHHGRTEGAIRSRLIRHGQIENINTDQSEST